MTTFHIHLSPQMRSDRLHIEKRGATLLLNGETFDPSRWDASAPANHWVIGKPEPREDGWFVTILFPHGSPAPHATRFPVPISVSDDGPVELPPHDGPDDDAEQLRATIAERLSKRPTFRVTTDGKMNIPRRLTLKDMPEGVYFHETASPFFMFPGYGAVVANVIATTSVLEHEMMRTAVSQHGTGAMLAVQSAFEMLKRKGQRKEYTRLVAQTTGRQQVYETINWAFTVTEPLFEIRNRFAHNIWGECAEIPDAFLLSDPDERLLGQAAHTQLSGHNPAEQEAQRLIRIACGEGGSNLSEADKRIILEIAINRQQHPAKIEALDLSINDLFGLGSPAEIWTADDFQNAAHAAAWARTHVVPHLQQIKRWLHGELAEADLKPLPGLSPTSAPDRRKKGRTGK